MEDEEICDVWQNISWGDKTHLYICPWQGHHDGQKYRYLQSPPWGTNSFIGVNCMNMDEKLLTEEKLTQREL